MKKIFILIRRNYYARKLYKIIKNIMKSNEYAIKIEGYEYICFINKNRLGKRFKKIKQELWLPQIMKDKYKYRFLKCENSDLKDYYRVSFYVK